MIRLALRQFRFQAVVAAIALACVAVLLAISGHHLYHLYNTTVGNCSPGADCTPAQKAFLNNDQILRQLLGLLLLIVPALLGMFWGAPLVAREYETGTFRLSWTQSVSRGRWLLTKLGLIGLASMAIAGLLSLLFTWWSRPFEWVSMNRFMPGEFDQRGVVVVGYALFAFALGLTAGVVLRRTVPAMAATLLAFLAVRLAFTFLVRSHLMAPAHASMPITSGGGMGFTPTSSGVAFVVDTPSIPNAWAISSQYVDRSGHVVTNNVLQQFVVNACPDIMQTARSIPTTPGVTHAPANQTAFTDCVDQISNHYHLLVAYQPADRYWTFQWIELAIFVALSFALAAFSFWWVRFRLA